MAVFVNFVHLPSAVEDNNTDPVIIWRQLSGVRGEDSDHKENIGMLINLLRLRSLYLIRKYRVRARYAILTYNVTILAR
jgi:hypothetical protein